MSNHRRMIRTAQGLLTVLFGLLASFPVYGHQAFSIGDFEQTELGKKRLVLNAAGANNEIKTADLVLALDARSEGSRYYGVPIGRRSLLYGYRHTFEPDSFDQHRSYTHWLLPLSGAGMEVDRWLNPDGATQSVYTFGYAWKNLKVENRTSTFMEDDRRGYERERLKWRASSSRLSYRPASDLELKIIRRHLSSFDQLEANGGLRRVAVAATYSYGFANGNWEATIAWGRSSRKLREPVKGYLLESSIRINNAHTFFSRVEQVGSDALFPENDLPALRYFRLNKMTAGYFYDVRGDFPINFDVGGLISKYRVPAAMSSLYGDDPMTYTAFIRFYLD